MKHFIHLNKQQNIQEAVKRLAGYDVAAFRPISARDNQW